MTHQSISLDAIDFSQPDGEFIYQGQTYQLKRYSGLSFFRNKMQTSSIFVCFFEDLAFAEAILEEKVSPQVIEQGIQQRIYDISRCVQYKNIPFCFGLRQGQYYSLKSEYWKLFNWKAPRHISPDDLIEKPYTFFVDQAKNAYEKELPYIEDKELHDSFRTSDAIQPIEFLCGSESELKRLTQLAAFTLPEFRPLFEQYSGFKLIYESENDYHYGGIAQIDTDDWIDEYEAILSRQAQQLFDLIFKCNFFTGLQWEYSDGRGYTGYDPRPYTIEVEVHAPSQHERLEAALELHSWLEGKLSQEEICFYFPPN